MAGERYRDGRESGSERRRERERKRERRTVHLSHAHGVDLEPML